MKAINHLLSYSISKMFDTPVDPIKDNCSDYLSKIKKPMDLGTIKTKLINNEYQKINDLKQDVQRVWENTYTYNGKHSIVSHMAKQLEDIFKNETYWLTGNEVEDWVTKYDELKNSSGFQVLTEKISPKSLTTKTDFYPNSEVYDNESFLSDSGKDKLFTNISIINEKSPEKRKELYSLITGHYPENGLSFDVDLSNLNKEQLININNRVQQMLLEL